MLMDIKKIIEDKVSSLAKDNITLRNEIEEMKKQNEKHLDQIFNEVVAIVDAFDKAEAAIKERGLDQTDEAQKAIKRLLNAKKKVTYMLDSHNVKCIEFPDGMSDDQLCEVVDTEPDPLHPTGHVVSIEKNGYTREGHLIRRAEVVIVKN